MIYYLTQGMIILHVIMLSFERLLYILVIYFYFTILLILMYPSGVGITHITHHDSGMLLYLPLGSVMSFCVGHVELDVTRSLQCPLISFSQNDGQWAEMGG